MEQKLLDQNLIDMMSKSLKTIIVLVIIAGVIVLLIFREDLVGQAFAALAGGVAIFKSKFFNSSKTTLEEEIGSIDLEHTKKRNDWEIIKEEYDNKFHAMKARIDYLDYRSAKIAKELKDLDVVERRALERNRNATQR
ncbi:hypothetical protein [Ekhidna sp.]